MNPPLGSFVGPPTGQTILYTFGSPGPTQLCATPTNPCYDPTPICLDLDVQPLPVAYAPPPITVCVGDPVLIHFTGNGDWEFHWGIQIQFGCYVGQPAQQGVGDLEFTAANNGTVPETCLIAVSAHQGDCSGDGDTWTVTALPKTTVSTPPDVTVCGGKPVSVAFSGTPGAVFN